MSKDTIRERIVEQGHVTGDCLITTEQLVSKIGLGVCPCHTCDEDRRICKGKPRRAPTEQSIKDTSFAPPTVGQPNVYYCAGVDPAPALGKNSDDGAIAIAKWWPRSRQINKDYFSENLTDWWFGFVGACRLRGASATTWSGKIHELHSRYNFSIVTMDPGGGGNFIMGELRSKRQKVLGNDKDCRPICTLNDTIPDGWPILRMFKRGDYGVESLWNKLTGDDFLADHMHVTFLDAVETGQIVFPVPWNDRSADERARIEKEWSPQDCWAIKDISLGMKQLTKIRVIVNDVGEWVTTKRGAKQFEAVGKKDVAYAMIYAYIGFKMWIRSNTAGMSMGGDLAYAGEML